MSAPANTIQTPTGFDPANPGNIFSQLPDDGADQFDRTRTAGQLIGPLSRIDTLVAASRTRLRILDYPYGIEEPTDELSLRTYSHSEVSEASGAAVWLTVKTEISDLISELSGQDLERTVLVPTLLKIVLDRYDYPLVVVGHSTSPYLEFYKIYSDSTVAKLANPATLPTAAVREAVISPDGSMVVYQQSGSQIVKSYLNSNYTFTANSAFADQPGNSGQMFWSKRGQHVFQITTNVSPYYKIWRRVGNTLETAGGSLDTAPTGNLLWADYSPDDAFLAITFAKIVRVYQRIGESYQQVAQKTLSGGNAALFCAWSPDGKLLFASSNGSPYVTMFEWDSQSFTLTDITSTAGVSVSANTQSVEWSPKGTYLMLTTSAVGTGPAGYLRLYRRASSTTLTEVTTGLPDFGASPRAVQWGPYDDFLVMFRDAAPRLRFWKVNPATNSFTLLTDPTSPAGSYFNTNTLAIWPQSSVLRTLATGATVTMPLKVGYALAANLGVFDPYEAQSTVTYNAAPRLGASMVYDPSGWTVLYGGSAETYVDDAFSGPISLPFDLTIGGVSSNQVFVSSNGYITLGAGSDVWVPSASNPALPKVLCAAYDLRMWDVYTKSGMYADSAYTIIRFQGNAFVGAYNVRNVIWELTIVQPDSVGNQLLELRIGTDVDTYGLAGGISVCSATTNLGSLAPAEANTSYTISGDSAGQAWTVQSSRSLANNLLVDKPPIFRRGTYQITGKTAGTLVGHALQAATGGAAITGGSSAIGKILPASGGSLPLTGAAGLGKGYRLNAQPSAVVVSGGDAAFISAVSPGHFAISGSDSFIGKVLVAGTGEVLTAGNEAFSKRGYKLNAQAAALNVQGADANLSSSAFFVNWATQTFGYEALVFPEWWAD